MSSFYFFQQVNAYRSMMHDDMMIGAYSHSTAVGKLRLDHPEVPKDARVMFPRYTLDEAATVSHYYMRYFHRFGSVEKYLMLPFGLLFFFVVVIVATVLYIVCSCEPALVWVCMYMCMCFCMSACALVMTCSKGCKKT